MHKLSKDSGWSWLVCFGSSVAMLLETGMVKALGVTLPQLQEQFSADTWVIGTVISLAPGLGAISCLFGGPFAKLASPRIVMMIFGLLSSVGLIVGSMADSITVLVLAIFLNSFSYGAEAITLSALPLYFDKYYDLSNGIAHAGISIGLMILPPLTLIFMQHVKGFSYGAEAITLSALPLYFDKYYDLSNGIAHAGISIGLMILPPLTQFFLDTYGWRGTFMLLGGLNLHLIVCGAMLRPVQSKTENQENQEMMAINTSEKDYHSIGNGELRNKNISNGELKNKNNISNGELNNKNFSNGELNNNKAEKSTSLFASLVDYIDLDIFCNFDFVTLLCISTATGYFFTGWVIYFVPHMMQFGFGANQSAFTATVGGVGNLVGTLIFPLISLFISGKNILYIFSLITSLALAMDPWVATMHSRVGVMISALLVNLGFAVIDCSMLKEVTEVVEEKKHTTAINWWFIGYSVGSLSSGFLSGWLFDYFGNYTTSFLFLSATLPLSVTPWLIRDISNAVKGQKACKGDYVPIR